MNNKLIFIATMALVLAGCGDNDVATTGEPSMVDKAMDSGGDAAKAVKDTTSDVVEGASDMESDAADAVSDTASNVADDAADLASDAVDTAKEVVPEDMTNEEAQEYMDTEMEKLKMEVDQ